MLEFLKECDQFNIYSRAHDAEIKLNTFDCITPMAVFFETTFKSLYGEFFPNEVLDRSCTFFDLLKTPKFTAKLSSEYKFEDINTVHKIRTLSNRLKHAVDPSKEANDVKKDFFKCLFNFSACYYYKKTRKAKPVWNDKGYTELLASVFDAASLKKTEEKWSSKVQELSSAIDKEKLEKDNLNKELEKLQKELEVVKFENADIKELTKLHEKVAANKNKELELESSIEVQDRKLINLKKHKEEIEKSIVSLEYDSSADKEEHVGLLRLELEEVQQDINDMLLSQVAVKKELDVVKTKRSHSEKELDAFGRKSANSKKLNELNKSLRLVESKRDEAKSKLESIKKELAQAESKLYVTRSDIEKSFEEYQSKQNECAELYDRKDKLNKNTRELQDLLDIKSPSCPRCQSIMKIRINRAEGNAFWGCSKFPNCRGYLENNDLMECASLKAQIDAGWDQFNGIKGKYESLKKTVSSSLVKFSPAKLSRYNAKFIQYKAYPYSFVELTPSAYLFESLAVPPEIFDEKERFNLTQFSRFMLTTNLVREKIDPVARTIYSMTLRLLNRGIVLPENKLTAYKLREKFNLKDFGRIESLFNYIQYDKPENPYGSDRERVFAEHYLPQVLGPNWASFTIAQPGFDMLIPNCPDDFKGQRADFLLVKNGKKVIIELDGPEHAEHIEADRARDRLLANNGYIGLRIPNQFIDRLEPKVTEALKRMIGVESQIEQNTDVDDRYLVATKLVHQLAIAIVKGLELGSIPSTTNLKAEISKSIFVDSELQYILALAANEVQDLIDRFASLYDQKISLDLFNENCAPISICVGDGNSKTTDYIILRDFSVDFNCLCDIEPFDINLTPRNCDPETLEFFLNYIYGYEHFRDGQYNAIERLMTRHNSIILLPTGAGKSIIYQLSSFLVPGITVIISPLKALMEDQVINLEDKFGITSAIPIMSGQSVEYKETQLEVIKHNSLSMIYIAPERLQIPKFRESVAGLMEHNGVYTVAIDEAHCVSEWGHDFRPAYLNIANVVQTLFKKGDFIPSLTALTGTASPHVLADVKNCLKIDEEDAIILPSSFDREELHYSIVNCASEDKVVYIADILKNDVPKKLNCSYEDFVKLDGDNTKSGIVFTPLRETQYNAPYAALNVRYSLKQALPEMGISCYFSTTPDGYDDATWAATLKENASSFKRNKINVLVATKAFGMGIDKSNVRFVIHDGLPSSLEQYYQEAGRAGRDRSDSYCYLVFSEDKTNEKELLLSKDKDIDDVLRYNEENKMNRYDDLSTALYFHAKAFKGIDEECEYVKTILAKIPEKEFKAKHCVNIYDSLVSDDDKKQWQKAMIRLINLGVFKDYTDNYRDSFIVECGSIARKSIIDNFAEFVRRDNEQRSLGARRDAEAIKSKGYDFVIDIARLMIVYIYDNIEKGRREAVRTMYTMARDASQLEYSKQEAHIRNMIISYLEVDKTQGENSLSCIETSEEAGLSYVLKFAALPSVKGEISNREKNRYQDLSMKVARMLESRPDQPALLLLRSLCEMMLKNTSPESVVKDITDAVRYAKDRYSVKNDVLLKEFGNVLVSVLNVNNEIFDQVIKNIETTGLSFNDLTTNLLASDEISSDARDYVLLSYLEDKLKNV